MNKVSSKSAVTNMLWRLAERFGAQGVTVIVEIILARVLNPQVYGTVALITVFTTILQVFVDSGLGTALVQKKDADQLDFSSVFYTNLFVCLILYAGMFFAAPAISTFYNIGNLTPIIRVTSLVLIISGVKNVQQAYVSRNLLFRKFFFATLGGTIGAALIGIWMAYHGFGVWALVVQMLFNQAVDTLILWITVKWRPTKEYSFTRVKQLFSYGWKLLASSLLETLASDLRSLIIGKLYTESDLAYYNRGRTFPQFLTNNTNSAINSVLLPVMSKAQDDTNVVRAMTRRAIKTSSFLIWPLMLGLAACAEPLVSLLLTDKWLPAVLFLRIFCITYAFYPIHTANLNALKAMGRSDVFLKLEVLKKIVSFAVLFATMWFGVEVMAYSLLFTSVCSQIINTWPNKKMLGYSYIDQLKDIIPSIALSLFMAICIYPIRLLGLSNLITLIIQILLGVIIYYSCSRFLKFESFVYLKELIYQFFDKRKKERNG